MDGLTDGRTELVTIENINDVSETGAWAYYLRQHHRQQYFASIQYHCPLAVGTISLPWLQIVERKSNVV